MKIDPIKTVAVALGGIDLVLNHWLPGGKPEGQEYLPLNPNRMTVAPVYLQLT